MIRLLSTAKADTLAYAKPLPVCLSIDNIGYIYLSNSLLST
jgi:hypothetical protein